MTENQENNYAESQKSIWTYDMSVCF